MERRIDLHLRVSYEPRALRPWLVLCVLLLSAGELGSENVTLTTYYPAPSGIYTQMITTNNTYLARDAGRVGVGTGAPAAKLDVSGPDVTGIRYLKSGSRDARITLGDPTRQWSAAVGWATAGDFSIIEEGVSGNRLYLQQGGNVGIGTSNPGYLLDVAGEIRTTGIKGAGCYTKPFSNTGVVYCNDTTNERAVAVEYDGTTALISADSVIGADTFTMTIPTTGTMMCCRLRP